eukprot:Hpha_TRINITY_DN14114_c1_g2::TRINITY_DN14114_c1_g2_i1::g.10540::m.10540
MASESRKQEWGTEGYFDLGCFKLDAVALLVSAGWSVVFSDPDNVFKKPPLRALSELESLHMDFLIQADHPECSSRTECPPAVGKRGRTANGGFYIFSARRKTLVSKLLRRAAHWCRVKPRSKLCCDDQQGLNKAIAEVVNGQGPSDGFRSAQFCAEKPGSRAAKPRGDMMRYCVMDPIEQGLMNFENG